MEDNTVTTEKTIADKVQETDFISPIVAQLMETMVAILPEFEARNAGAHWKAMVLQSVQVFPEDRAKVYACLGGKRKEAEKGGGAKITRGAKTGAAQLQKASGGCDNCPGVASNPAHPVGKHNPGTDSKEIARRNTPVEPLRPAGQEGTTTFESIEDVMDAFSGSAAAILAWAQTQGIQIPASVSTAKTAAKYVFNHQQQQNEEEE